MRRKKLLSQTMIILTSNSTLAQVKSLVVRVQTVPLASSWLVIYRSSVYVIKVVLKSCQNLNSIFDIKELCVVSHSLLNTHTFRFELKVRLFLDIVQ